MPLDTGPDKLTKHQALQAAFAAMDDWFASPEGRDAKRRHRDRQERMAEIERKHAEGFTWRGRR